MNSTTRTLRSVALAGTGLGLLLLGIEMFLATSGQGGIVRWASFVLVPSGIALAAMGPPLRGSVYAVVMTRAGVVLVGGLYLTITAFTRYPGLAKDIEPTTANIIGYFGKITAALALIILAAALFRSLFGRDRRIAGTDKAS